MRKVWDAKNKPDRLASLRKTTLKADAKKTFRFITTSQEISHRERCEKKHLFFHSFTVLITFEWGLDVSNSIDCLKKPERTKKFLSLAWAVMLKVFYINCVFYRKGNTMPVRHLLRSLCFTCKFNKKLNMCSAHICYTKHTLADSYQKIAT